MTKPLIAHLTRALVFVCAFSLLGLCACQRKNNVPSPPSEPNTRKQPKGAASENKGGIPLLAGLVLFPKYQWRSRTYPVKGLTRAQAIAASDVLDQLKNWKKQPQNIALLKKALKHKEKSTRRIALTALLAIKATPDHSGAFKKALQDKDWMVCVLSATALGHFPLSGVHASAYHHSVMRDWKRLHPNRSPQSVRALCPGRTHTPEERKEMRAILGQWYHPWPVLAYAVEILGQDASTREALIPTLIGLLRTHHDPLFEIICKQLAKSGPKAIAALKKATLVKLQMRDALSSDRYRTPLFAHIRALGKMGPGGIPALQTLLGKSGRRQLRYRSTMAQVQIAKALGDSGPQALPVLKEMLERGHFQVREACLQVIASLGPGVLKKSLPIITPWLMDRIDHVRKAALDALGRLGPGAKAALPAIARSFQDKDIGVRIQASRTIGRFGKLAFPHIRTSLVHQSYLVRYHAVMALFHLGDQASPLLPELQKAMLDQQQMVRKMATRTLGRMGGNKAAVRLLLQSLQSNGGEMKIAIVDALENARTLRAQVVAALLKLIQENNVPGLRAKAKESLMALGPHAIPALKQASNSKNSEIRAQAKDILTRLQTQAKKP